MTTGIDNIDWVELGQVLREARAGVDLSYGGAANELCLSNIQIRALESGLGTPFHGVTVRSWCARRYATLLGLDWDQIVQPLRDEKTFEAATETSNLPEASPVELVFQGTGGQNRTRLWLGTVVLLMFVAIVINLGTRAAPSTISPPIADVFLRADTPASTGSAGDAAATVRTALRHDRRVNSEDEATLLENKKWAADEPQTAARRVVEVQGGNWRKSPDYFFITSKTFSVLVIRKLGGASEEVHMDFARGAARRVPIAADEVIRVKDGKGVEIFYQGRMLPLQIIASGDWTRFIPKFTDQNN